MHQRCREIPLQGLKSFLLSAIYASWAGSVAAAVFMNSPGGVAGTAALWPNWRSLIAWAVLFYSAAGPGAAADVFQQVSHSEVPSTPRHHLERLVPDGGVRLFIWHLNQVGQTAVGAAEANVILCAEPLFTAFTARILLGELTGAREKVGGSLILAAALIASGSFKPNKKGSL